MIPAGARVVSSAMVGVELVFTFTNAAETLTYPCAIASADEFVAQQGQHRLARLVIACGLETLSDSEELHGKMVSEDLAPGIWEPEK